MAKRSKLKLGILAGLGSAILGCLYAVRESAPQTPKESVEIVNKKLVKENDPEKVDLEILVDMAFLDKHNAGWWNEISREFDFVDKRFRKTFGIDFEVDAVKYFELPQDSPPDIFFALAYLRLHFKPGQFDAFVFVSGKEYGIHRGICQDFGNHLVVTSYEPVIPLRRTLQHELSHLFGARDYKKSKTIMSNNKDFFSYEWSEENSTILKLNRCKSWDGIDEWYYDLIRGNINEFPEEDRDEVRKLFCYTSSSCFYPESIPLAEKLCAKYPKNEFIKSCHDEILGLKQ